MRSCTRSFRRSPRWRPDRVRARRLSTTGRSPGSGSESSPHPSGMRLAAVGSGRLAASTRLDSVGRGTTMTADVSSSYSGAPTSGHSGLARTGMALFGGAAVVVGGFLLFNPFAAVRTLALLLGLSLVIGGCLEIALGWESGRRASGILLGAVLIVGGLLAAFWPEATVWTLAVLTGVSLLGHGVGRSVLAVAARAGTPGWGWSAMADAAH